MRKFLATALGTVALVVTGMLSHSSIGKAQPPIVDPETQTKILRGFQIAPVPLNMVGLDPAQVGYGSYLVNTYGCNDCHSAGPQTVYTAAGNPYTGKPVVTNPATYLGGGRDFGAFPDPAGPFPHIISRNLTPDKTGLPIGGDTFAQFTQVIRTGLDPDHVHPTCAGPPNGKCLPAPFNGDILQIMPWPGLQFLTDNDLRAIYAYLSAIPCLEGGPGEPANRCTPLPKTTATVSPKNLTVTAREVQLDGSKSASGDGGKLSFQWSVAPGSPSASILHGNTATPSVQFTQGRSIYTFQLTVTDASGQTATDVAVVNYQGN